MHNALLAVGLTVASLVAPEMSAAEISGEVTQVDGDAIAIKILGNVKPSEGDEVQIFIEVPDVGEAEVATATVTAVLGNIVLAKVGPGAGHVTTRQKARIRRTIPTDEKEADSDLDRLQGMWRNDSALREGKPSDSYVGVLTIVKGNRITFIFPGEEGTKRLEGKFTLDPNQTPKRLNWTPDGTDDIRPRIYELNGNSWNMGSNMGTGPPPRSMNESKFQFIMSRVTAVDVADMLVLAEANAASFVAAMKQAEAGDAQGQFDAAMRYQTGRGVGPDFSAAAAWFEKAARQGHSDAKYQLAVAYATGKGVAPNPETARSWMFDAANTGQPEAQNYAGSMYESDTGVSRDFGQAASWYRKAAENGFAPAMVNLGRLYEAGQGIEQSNKQALSWFHKAAQLKNADGQYHVGRFCLDGKGVRQNYDAALGWFRAAAAQNHAEAQNAIGYIYQNGFGVRQDIDEALRWYRLAAAQGNQTAINNIEAMGLNP